jgi:dTDP-4-amino-4,6-dideoxygalactose transaminase
MPNILYRGKIIPRRKIHFIEGELYLAVKNLFRKNIFVQDTIPLFENKFSDFIGVKHSLAVSSGRFGMELILRALNLNRGDEIIIPAYTLGNLAAIIKSLGLVPIPADINLETFNLDPESIVKRLSSKTRVILATHIFGVPCDIDKIIEIGKSKSLYIIEDCAHSVGSEFKSRKTGFFGLASFFSFEVIKPLNTYGGGMIATNDEFLAEKVRKIYFSRRVKDEIPFRKIWPAFLENYLLPVALSYPLLYLLSLPALNKAIYNIYRKLQKASSIVSFSNFQAYLGLKKLESLEQRIAQRQRQARFLKSLLSNNIIPQYIGKDILPNYYFFVARLRSDPVRTRRYLLNRGIDSGIGAEIADDCGKLLGRYDCPNTSSVFNSTIHLPFHDDMPEDKIKYLSKVLNAALS